MGDARNRASALAAGQPWPEDLHRCPACRSRRTLVSEAPAMALSHIPTLIGVCADCKAFWEAFPPGWSHDVCAAGPCDNCAFSPQSPEILDRAAWREMLAKLKAGQEFKCHKGAPILIDKVAGTCGFDEHWVQTKGRTCAGFHRAIMTRPEWFAARYPAFAEAMAEEDAG